MCKSIPIWVGVFCLIPLVSEVQADIALSVSDPLFGPGFVVVVFIESVVFLLFRHALKLPKDITFKKIFIAVIIANFITAIIGFFFPPIRHDDRDIITFAAAFFLTWILEGGIYTVFFWGAQIRIRTLFFVSLMGNIITYVCIILLLLSWGPGKSIRIYDKRAKWMAKEVVYMSYMPLSEGRMVPFDAATLCDYFKTGKLHDLSIFRLCEIEEIPHPLVGNLKKMIVHGDSYMLRLGLGKDDYYNILLNVTNENVLTVVWHNKGKKVYEIRAGSPETETEDINTYPTTEKDTKIPWDALKADHIGQKFFKYQPYNRSRMSESDSGLIGPTRMPAPPKAKPGRGRVGYPPSR